MIVYEDDDVAVCDGARIGHCIAMMDEAWPYLPSDSPSDDRTFCVVVWGTAPAPICMPFVRWQVELVRKGACHPVETGDHCEHCAQARESLRRAS